MATSSMDVQSPPTAPPRRIAPLWHTIVLILVLGAFSYLGAKSGHPVARAGLVPQYVSMMIVEWLAFGYVLWGIHKGGVLTVRQMIGGRWEKVEDFLLEIGIAAAFWIVSLLVLGGCAYVLGMTKGGAQNLDEAKKILGFLVPRTNLEIVLWICVALTAGFCEEFIFRGYIQRQFAAISRSVFVGMAVSSIVFGLAHGYEGGKRMLLIFVYGFLFSSLAELRKSLRPGMMAHAWHDAFTGLVMRVLFK
ncbi:MAG TPA: type II CAAX endopeptidase family protein [Terriglobales bacterium]|nr:type II CAAX endopeptidase family protein [Terriglobales bacterium]